MTALTRNTPSSLFHGQSLLGYSQSRMSPFDEYALHRLLEGKSDLSILEIGSWLGAGSTRILSKYAARLVCVDHWEGNENADHKQIVSEIDPYCIFYQNVEGFREKIITVRSDSSAIGDLLRDQSFDFIFIDGDHRYRQTMSDIINCLPKVKRGGIIAGHDCEARLPALARRFSPDELDKDHISSPIEKFSHFHPGVISSVYEIFGDDVHLFADDANRIYLPDGLNGFSTIWWKSV